MSARDVTDGNSEEVAHGGSEEEAAWLDLVGRFDAPAAAGDTPAPWPESENLTLPAAPAARAIPPGAGLASSGAAAAPADPPPEAEEHYVPPPPPPLPRLSPVTKGAWVALFGGPGYLLAATMAGWAIPSWLGFAAVAAFIGGFIVLVLHVGDDHDRDSGPDDGAVV